MLPNGTLLPVTAKVPDLLAQSSNGEGECNTDIPTGAPLQQYQAIVGFLAGNGFYVVRDPWDYSNSFLRT